MKRGVIRYNLRTSPVTSNNVWVPSRPLNSYALILEKVTVYSVSISAATSKGFNESLEPAVIYIARENQELMLPKRPRIISSSNNQIEVNWDGTYTNKITVHWCLGSVQDKTCKSSMRSEISANNRPIIINVEKNSADYIFAISSTSNNEISTRLHWMECIYGKRMAPPVPKVHKLQQLLDGRLTLTWDEPSCQKDTGFTHHYLIKYCQVQQCSDATKITTKKLPGDTCRHDSSYLEPGVSYTFSIQAVSPKGLQSDTVIRQRKLQRKGLIVVEIAVIAIGGCVLMILVVIGLVGIYRKCKINMDELKNQMKPVFPEMIEIEVDFKEEDYDYEKRSMTTSESPNTQITKNVNQNMTLTHVSLMRNDFHEKTWAIKPPEKNYNKPMDFDSGIHSVQERHSGSCEVALFQPTDNLTKSGTLITRLVSNQTINTDSGNPEEEVTSSSDYSENMGSSHISMGYVKYSP